MQLVPDIRYHARNIVRELGFLQKKYCTTGVTYSESHALVELDRLQTLEPGELSKLLQIDKSVGTRLLQKMQDKGWIKPSAASDGRKRRFQLTAPGRKKHDEVQQVANTRIENTLRELSKEEQETVREGLALFARALKSARIRASFSVRPIQRKDDPAMAKIVRQNLKDMGFAGPGTAAADPTLDSLSKLCSGKRSRYFVLERDGKVLGGAGIVPLTGGENDTCELIRMFLSSEVQGLGAGQLLMDTCLAYAKKTGYSSCYLETTEQMQAAQHLYQRNGFDYVKKRRGNTGHFACTVLMERALA